MAAPEWVQLQSSITPKSKEDSTSKRIRDLKRRHKEAIRFAYQKGFLRRLDYEFLYEHTFGRKVPKDDGSEEDEDLIAPDLNMGELLWLNIGNKHIRTIDETIIFSCEKLRICILSSNYVSDITPFHSCINLVKLDLRDNQIDKLPNKQFWASLKELRILYLHGNTISSKDCIRKLNACPKLHLLTMYDTPISLMKNYRHHVVNSVWSLKALDHFVISDEEIIEDIYLKGAFAAFSSSFKIQLYMSCSKHSSFVDEHKQIYGLLLMINRTLAKFSPVVIMQRFIRGWLTRLKLKKSGITLPKKPVIISIPCKQEYSIPPTPVTPQNSLIAQENVLKSPVHQRVSFNLSPISEDKVLPQQGTRLDGSTSGSRASVCPSAPPTSRRSSLPSSAVSVGSAGASIDPPAPSVSPQRKSVHINLYWLEQKMHDVEVKDTMPNEVASLPSALPSVQNKSSKPKTTAGAAITEDLISELPKTTTIKEVTAPHVQKKDDKLTLPKPSPRVGALDEDSELGIAGKMMGLWFGNPYADMLLSKKEDGETVRAAMREYGEMLRHLPPKKVVKHNKLVTPEERAFNRIYTTMTLSALKAVERVYESRKKVVAMTDKINTVKRVKQDLMDGRHKINEFHRSRQEVIHNWREEESKKQAKATEVKEAEKKMVVKRKQYRKGLRLQRKSIQAADKKFVEQFSHQNNLVKHTLAQEDSKLLRDEIVHEKVESTKQQREDELRMLHEVRRYMEYRGLKLRSEGATEKARLNAEVLETTNQRLMDARNSVARLRARQEAANQTVTAKFQNITKLLEEEVTAPVQPNPTLEYLTSLVGKLEESPEYDTHYRLRRLRRDTRSQDSRTHSSAYTESRATTLSTDLDGQYSRLMLQLEDPIQKSALIYPMMPPQPVLHVVEPQKEENENEKAKPKTTPTPPPSTTDLDALDVHSIPLLV